MIEMLGAAIYFLILQALIINCFNLYTYLWLMKNIILFIILLCWQVTVQAQLLPPGISSKTKIYLVRHAEKQSGTDPELTDAGKKRAGDLMRTLQNKKVQRIYVTQFKRTQITGDSMRLQLGIDTVHYQADENGIDLFNKIAAHGDFNKSILIIGHSNTVPDYIKKLGVANYPQANIGDTEFDNLFKVYYKRPFLFSPFKAYVKRGKYGAASGGICGNAVITTKYCVKTNRQTKNKLPAP
jgi:phosphohistidine phosphatase SixA